MSSIEIAITDGKDVWQLAWIRRTSSSIVASVIDPSNPAHVTYHQNGYVHIKVLEGAPLKNDHPLAVPIVGVGSVVRNEHGKVKGFQLRPLNNFHGIEYFYRFVFVLSSESIECLPQYGQSRRKPDAVFYLDTRCFRSNTITVELGIMSRNYSLPLSLDEPCSAIYYFFTLSTPWLVISAKEESLNKP